MASPAPGTVHLVHGCKKALVCTNILVLVAQMNDLAKCYFHRFKLGGAWERG